MDDHNFNVVDAFTMPDDDAPPAPKVKHPDAIPAYVEPVNPAQVGSLDLSKEKDRDLLRRSLNPDPRTKGGVWPGLDEKFRAKAVECLGEAMDMARRGDSVRDRDSVVRTTALLMGQQLEVDAQEDKNRRLDEGKSTENQGIQVTYVNRIHAKD